MHKLLVFALLAMLAAFVPIAAAQDATLVQAKQLMDKRDAAGAYKLLKPLEDERAGQPDFDYLLGIAALDVGRNTEAVFALERVLAVNPDHVQARAEIARAYSQLGEMETARREFETLRKQPMPPEAAATIQKYIDAIEQATGRRAHERCPHTSSSVLATTATSTAAPQIASSRFRHCPASDSRP